MKPDIYFFNPTCELAVANGSPNFMAPAQLRRFENEVGTLPLVMARPTDIVLADQIPPRQFCGQLESAGFTLPTFQVLGTSLFDPGFLSGEKGFLFPWGWSPATHKLLSPLKSGCCPGFQNSPVVDWREIHRELYGRKSALEVLKSAIRLHNTNNILSYNDLPEICTEHGQIAQLQRRWGKVVVKAPWSSSGRGLQVLRPNEYNQTNRQVISGFLKQQGYVTCGPWHHKVIDLSFQFFSLGDGNIEFRGLASFKTDHIGRYTGNFIQELPHELIPGLEDFLLQNLPVLKISLSQCLISSNYSTDYFGWLGIDTLIYKAEDGKFNIHPCIEINCRLTMGAVALGLRGHLSEGSIGEFRIAHGMQGDFAQFCKEMNSKSPLVMENGKIVRGFLPLTPTLPNTIFGAWICVKDKIGRLRVF